MDCWSSLSTQKWWALPQNGWADRSRWITIVWEQPRRYAMKWLCFGVFVLLVAGVIRQDWTPREVRWFMGVGALFLLLANWALK